MILIEVGRHFLALLPLFVIFAALLSYGIEIPQAVTRTLLIWAALSLTASEILGISHSLTFGALLSFWCLISAIFAVLYYRNRGMRARARSIMRLASSSYAGILIALYMSVLLVIALKSAPNNYNSLTYHLPRIEHWIQDRSLEPYPTMIGRQISLGPMAEILILQFRLIAGTDLFSALVQWLGLLGVIAGSVTVAKQLGAGTVGRSLTALFAATVPMGILQSTSTQTDLITGFFVIAFVERMLSLRKEFHLVNSVEAAAAIALGFLTKVTALLFCFPFGAWVMIWLVSRWRWAQVIKVMILGVVIFVATNFMFFWRNYKDFGSVYADLRGVGNKSFGIEQLINTTTLDAVSNLATGFPAIDKFITEWTLKFCEFSGAAAYKNDTQFANLPFELPGDWRVLHEDYASNPIHLLLIIGCVLYSIMHARSSEMRERAIYSGCLVTSFLLFAGTLRWQPWIMRLELPLFFLGAPLVGASLERLECRFGRRGILVLETLLAALSLPWLLWNPLRPILPLQHLFQPRFDSLFMNSPYSGPPYKLIADALQAGKYQNIGLIMNDGDWEYPIWVTLGPSLAARGGRIEYADTSKTVVKSYPRGPFDPDVLFLVEPVPPDEIQIGSENWTKFMDLRPLALYKPDK